MATCDLSSAWKSCVVSAILGEPLKKILVWRSKPPPTEALTPAPAALQSSLKLSHPGTKMGNQSIQQDPPFAAEGLGHFCPSLQDCQTTHKELQQ